MKSRCYIEFTIDMSEVKSAPGFSEAFRRGLTPQLQICDDPVYDQDQLIIERKG